MLARLRERSEAENGFTLIELLVVMIIISILMAVAVPTFLSQKNNALKTQATSNIKQVITAMESCAAAITQGGYNDGTLDCGSKAVLEAQEASLQALGIDPAAPATITATQVALTASNQGFIVQRRINDSGGTIYFAEIHTDAGQIYKLCGSSAFSTVSTTSTAVATSKTCKRPGSATAAAW